MEKWFFIEEDGYYTACYWGSNKEDVIMKVWVENDLLKIL